MVGLLWRACRRYGSSPLSITTNGHGDIDGSSSI
jgi:hypothetical protein